MKRVALVTGGSRGIGRAICLELARGGYDVAVNYQGAADAAEETARLCREAGARAETYRADVADYGQVQALVEHTIADLGGLYAVVANAGIPPRFGYVNDTTPVDWHRMMDVNLNGVYHTFHAAAPHLIEQKAGRMVVISSYATVVHNPGFGAYAVSKAATESLVKVMGKELAQYGVLVNAVSPGLFDTDMGRNVIDRYGEEAVSKTIPVQRTGDPAEVANLVAFLLSDKAGFMTASVYPINGGGRGIALRP